MALGRVHKNVHKSRGGPFFSDQVHGGASRLIGNMRVPARNPGTHVTDETLSHLQPYAGLSASGDQRMSQRVEAEVRQSRGLTQGQNHRALNRWQHRLKRERPTCTERNKSLLESADGSMATVATRPGEIHVPHCANRIDLTPTGLLMEGVSARVRFSFALFGVDEWNGDISTDERFTQGMLGRPKLVRSAQPGVLP